MSSERGGFAACRAGAVHVIHVAAGDAVEADAALKEVCDG
jgi:biotin carboxyl carrier protein